MKRRNNAMMNYAKRGAALLLALVFCLGLLPPAGAEGDTITIHDASGLLKLAQSCTSDTWSQGVTVVLAADISLAGTGFPPFPCSAAPLTGPDTPFPASPGWTRVPR
ncbi:MAG: hypothetical protein ACLRZ3_06875 [Flavonifractor plautii]